MDSNEQQHLQREMALYVPIEKADMKRISYGVVLEPDTEDLQGDIIEAEEIEKAAHDWMVNSQKGGLMHTELVPGAKVVESFISPADFYVQKSDGNMEKVARGSWVLGIQWPENIWKRIISGELTGFSVGGSGVRVEVDEVKKVGPKGWVGGSFVNYARHGGNPAPEEGGGKGRKPPKAKAPTDDDEEERRRLKEEEEAGLQEVEEDEIPPKTPAQPSKPVTGEQIAEQVQREQSEELIEAERQGQLAESGIKVLTEQELEDIHERAADIVYEEIDSPDYGDDELREWADDRVQSFQDELQTPEEFEAMRQALYEEAQGMRDELPNLEYEAAPAGLVAENRGQANIDNSRRAGYMDASEDYELLEMDDDTIRGMVKENSQSGRPISQAEVDAYMEGVQQARNEAGVGPGSGSYEYMDETPDFHGDAALAREDQVKAGTMGAGAKIAIDLQDKYIPHSAPGDPKRYQALIERMTRDLKRQGNVDQVTAEDMRFLEAHNYHAATSAILALRPELADFHVEKSMAASMAEAIIAKVGPKGWAPGPYANYQRHGGSPSKERPKKKSPEEQGAGSGISESEYQSMIADVRTNTQAMTRPKHATRDGVVVEDQPKVTRVGGEQFQIATPRGQVVLDFADWKWLGGGGMAKSPKVTERGHWGVIPRNADENNPENYTWAKNETLAELMNRLPPGEYKLAR